MRKKSLVGLISTTIIGTSLASPIITNNHKQICTINKTLLTNNSINTSRTNEAIVIDGNSRLKLYALSNGSGIISDLSVGEMLTILGQPNNGFCKVKVQETGAMGYINISNMQNIINCTNSKLIKISGYGHVINVSSRLRLRTYPSINSNIISYLSNNESFTLLGKQGQWYKISVNGHVGFVYGGYVSIKRKTSNTINKKISTQNAKKELTNNKNTTAINNISNNVVPQTKHLTSNTKTSKLNSSKKSKLINHNIKWVESLPNSGISLNTIVVKNTNNTTISHTLLAQYMRKWILKGQDFCSGIFEYENTNWYPQWLNVVSDSKLVEAFIDANGETSLNKDITANEFNKATMKLEYLVSRNKLPFSQKKEAELIQQLFPDSIITKLTEKNGYYYVYTKQSGKNIYDVVNGYTGGYNM